jgi:hypothetical protein
MENTPDPSTTQTPDLSVANTPDFNTANTPAPICDECGSSPAHPAQFANPKPWCEDCIMDLFDLARVGNKVSAQISTPSLTAFLNRTMRLPTPSS